MKTRKRELGDLGENIACSFLTKHGFEILGRNYSRKWGEIDIITRKGELIRFIEVKSVSRVTSNGYRPEDNMHPWKIKRLSRAIQTYLLDKKVPDDKAWQVDVLSIELDFESRRARVKMLDDIQL